jgi:hypothetical protein
MKREFTVGGVNRAGIKHRADANGAQHARQQGPHIGVVVDDENVQLIDAHDRHGRASFFGRTFKIRCKSARLRPVNGGAFVLTMV